MSRPLFPSYGNQSDSCQTVLEAFPYSVVEFIFTFHRDSSLQSIGNFRLEDRNALMVELKAELNRRIRRERNGWKNGDGPAEIRQEIHRVLWISGERC